MELCFACVHVYVYINDLYLLPVMFLDDTYPNVDIYTYVYYVVIFLYVRVICVRRTWTFCARSYLYIHNLSNKINLY